MSNSSGSTSPTVGMMLIPQLDLMKWPVLLITIVAGSDPTDLQQGEVYRRKEKTPKA
ncbi:hypothetical protein AGR2A_pa60031 [Agrobacterium genomosp. 2 str. CFBP 5494]|uniref:Uncharacterized protein n=1 Tax=Agrobacterium genomosp. 2 str. CFBP 5494 TaxID=1183436 RepID=A0A9W5B7J6_9HYPH|nr:hypothetical protein AGR2A_pa60031 [Agrobacterium genomosp. 2 str. CFBP 5494]